MPKYPSKKSPKKQYSPYSNDSTDSLPRQSAIYEQSNFPLVGNLEWQNVDLLLQQPSISNSHSQVGFITNQTPVNTNVEDNELLDRWIGHYMQQPQYNNVFAFDSTAFANFQIPNFAQSSSSNNNTFIGNPTLLNAFEMPTLDYFHYLLKSDKLLDLGLDKAYREKEQEILGILVHSTFFKHPSGQSPILINELLDNRCFDAAINIIKNDDTRRRYTGEYDQAIREYKLRPMSDSDDIEDVHGLKILIQRCFILLKAQRTGGIKLKDKKNTGFHHCAMVTYVYKNMCYRENGQIKYKAFKEILDGIFKQMKDNKLKISQFCDIKRKEYEKSVSVVDDDYHLICQLFGYYQWIN